jgi:SAM-dependent methyltransferase
MNVDKTLSPDDGMFQGNAEHYFSCGKSALHVIQNAIGIAGAITPGHILDYGSGAGRVTRWMKAAYPTSSISACDVREQDVNFLRDAMGIKAWRVDPSHFDIAPEQFDLIWVGSVITHLPEAGTRELIDNLLSTLRPNGLLVLSFHGQFAVDLHDNTAFKYIHDEGWQKIKRNYLADGYGYADYEGQDGYGISVCSPDWVTDLVNALSCARLVLISQRAWDNHHDVVAVQKVA